MHLHRAADAAHVLGIAADRLPGGPNAPPPPPSYQQQQQPQQPPLIFMSQMEGPELAGPGMGGGAGGWAPEVAAAVAARVESAAVGALVRLLCGVHVGLRWDTGGGVGVGVGASARVHLCGSGSRAVRTCRCQVIVEGSDRGDLRQLQHTCRLFACRPLGPIRCACGSDLASAQCTTCAPQ